MEGLLLVDKPTGWTSFDVVKYIRSLVARTEGVPARRIKVGHSGTLDPFATGLLVVLVGKKYTTRAQELLKQDKRYSVVMKLDSTSTTGDPDGDITVDDKPKLAPELDDIQKIVKTFEGEIWQTPPVYSAIKVNGVRAYKLARENKTVVLEPRKIRVNKISLISYNYPSITFVADVSSGTYIRTLVEDIAKALDRTAYTVELRRITNGIYSVEEAVDVQSINEQTISTMLQKIDENA